MEFQVIKSSPWAIRSMYVVMFLSFVGMMATAVFSRGDAGHWGTLVAGAVGIVGATGYGVIVKRTIAKNNESFNARLMEEYDATSNRSFSAIWEDLYQYNEAGAVFTSEGKGTQIFVKPTNRGKNDITMVFTMLDASALYPKRAAKQFTTK